MFLQLGTAFAFHIVKKKSEEEAILIFNIQKCSIHDGEGLRTIVFFKGCPLHCKWCANPESQSYKMEIMEFPKKCVGCGECMKVCKLNAIHPDPKAGLKIDRSVCNNCFACADICYAEAKKTCGEEKTAEEIFKEVNKDRFFYEIRGGGVTFSGGEPLTQPELLYQTAKKCKANRLHTTMETCGFGKFEEFEKALDYIDESFFDIKHMDTEVHKELTGVGNEVILSNLKAIAGHGIPVTVRTPVIPGLNDSMENIVATAEFIKDIPNVVEYELLLYHNLGESKYTSLGKPYELHDIVPPTDDDIRPLVKAANQVLKPYGKQCFYTKKNKKEIVL